MRLPSFAVDKDTGMFAFTFQQLLLFLRPMVKMGSLVKVGEIGHVDFQKGGRS